MQRNSVDEVIQQLDNIVDWARSTKSRLGYFAALYRKVTHKVKEGIEDGFFEDGERMERLDVTFANRYLEAIEQYQSHNVPTRSWQVAFEASKDWWPIALQHLLLGINAHINLDLGVAASRTSPGDALYDLKNDFNKINKILAELVDAVEQDLARVWPTLKLLDRVGGKTDEAVINFSMERARDHAWKVAEGLAPLSEADQMPKIDYVDQDMAVLGRKIFKPGLIVGTVTKVIRLGERKTVIQIIDILL